MLSPIRGRGTHEINRNTWWKAIFKEYSRDPVPRHVFLDVTWGLDAEPSRWSREALKLYFENLCESSSLLSSRF